MRERAARARELAEHYPKAIVARVLQVSRQALYGRRPKAVATATVAKDDEVDRIVVEVAKANPTDGYRMVAAIASRKVGRPVNRKRALRVMRQHGLIQRRVPLGRRKRPGRFVVTGADQLWQLDMTSVWTPDKGWCYLMAIIDCCTREIVAWHLKSRCRAIEAINLVGRALFEHDIGPDRLTLGTDNGPAFTARAFIAYLKDVGVTHRRGGYRDPESQAFIESWFGKLKEREVWLHEYESVKQARRGIARYVAYYHDHPHSGLDYKTPKEVRARWAEGQKTAA